MTHPFLSNPGNLQAFQHLTAVPTGTVRTWAEALGWKKSRMERFLLNLARYGLGEVDARSNGSTFRPLSTVSVSDTSRTRLALNQDLGSGLTESRLQRPAVDKCKSTPGAEILIDAMNRVMKRFDSYLPVSADNYGSHRAAKVWLQSGLHVEEAAVILYRIVSGFDLDKSGGEYPRSLGYFTKAMLVEWRRIQRDRHQLSLMPEVDMKLEVA